MPQKRNLKQLDKNPQQRFMSARKLLKEL